MPWGEGVPPAPPGTSRVSSEELDELTLRTDADYNGDGMLTTQELDRFVKENMPRIAAKFPLMVANRRAEEMGYSLRKHRVKVEQTETTKGSIWLINYLPVWKGKLHRRGGGCVIEVNSADASK